MFYNNCSVRIVSAEDSRERSPQEDSFGRVFMRHMREYGIHVENGLFQAVRLYVKIDGILVDRLRLEASENGTIYTISPALYPHGSAKRLTYIEDDTPEAEAAGIKQSNPLRGLIQIRFVPVVKIPSVMPLPGQVSPFPQSIPSDARGGTGLTGQSNQTFEVAQGEVEELLDQQFEIRLLLVPIPKNPFDQIQAEAPGNIIPSRFA